VTWLRIQVTFRQLWIWCSTLQRTYQDNWTKKIRVTWLQKVELTSSLISSWSWIVFTLVHWLQFCLERDFTIEKKKSVVATLELIEVCIEELGYKELTCWKPSYLLIKIELVQVLQCIGERLGLWTYSHFLTNKSWLILSFRKFVKIKTKRAGSYRMVVEVMCRSQVWVHGPTFGSKLQLNQRVNLLRMFWWPLHYYSTSLLIIELLPFFSRFKYSWKFTDDRFSFKWKTNYPRPHGNSFS